MQGYRIIGPFMKQSSFEIFLDRLDPAWREDQLAFFRVVSQVGLEAVEELSGRVQRVSCPAGLKQLTLEFSFYHPWPEWVPVVDRLLRYEKDLDLFETGVRALGRIRTEEAMAALKTLSLSRATPGFREIVDEVLSESDPDEAFQHHFSRLLQGSAQPGDANEGAHQLAKLLTPESLEPLKSAVAHPDPLIFRHALRLIAQIPSEAAAAFLLAYLKDTLQDAVEDREARTILADFRSLSHPEVQQKTIQILTARWQELQPTAAEHLASGQRNRILGAISGLRQASLGILDGFLLDTLLAATDEKPTLFSKYLIQAGEAAQLRMRRIDFAMGATAQGLATMVAQNLIPLDQVIPVLADALRRNTGGIGVASALARLIPSTAQDLIDLLLDQADGALRSAALEILGDRKDPILRDSFLKLRRDAITDIADRSLWHLGQLPDPDGTARSFLAAPVPEEIAVGLRFIAMHRLEALVPDLLALATNETREAVLVAALRTLGTIGSAEAVAPLLGLLHSGQGPRIQIALAETLRDLGHPEGALALCVKAKELSTAMLHALAVEALAKAFDNPEHPLDNSGSAALVEAAQCGWSDRNPWPLRLRIADALLTVQVEGIGAWVELSTLLQTTLSEKRPPGSVPTEELARIQACARVLAQRATI